MYLPLGFLFRGLSGDQRKRIASVAKEVLMTKGREICKEGHEAKELYILKTGAVELVTGVDTKLELPIAMLRDAGSIFGAGVLVAPYRYTLTARCAVDGVMLSLERSAVHKLMQEDRDLGCILMTNLATQFLERLKEARHEIKIHFKTLLTTYC